MVKKIFIILLISQLFPVDISFKKSVSILHESNGGMWYPKNKSLNVIQPSFGIAIKDKKWNLQINYYFNMIFGKYYQTDFFNHQKGFFQEEAFLKSEHSFSWSDYDTYRIHAKFEYKLKNASVYFGKFNKQHFKSAHSITSANHHPSPLIFGFDWHINQTLKYC